MRPARREAEARTDGERPAEVVSVPALHLLRERSKEVNRVGERVRRASSGFQIVHALYHVVYGLIDRRQGRWPAERQIEPTVRDLPGRHAEYAEAPRDEVSHLEVGRAAVVRDVQDLLHEAIRVAP